ncbi:hypothetical protein Tco_1533070 [Tanacetum coccineum]
MAASLLLIEELARAADSDLTKDQLIVLLEREVAEDVDKIMDFSRLFSELRASVRKRDVYIAELRLYRSCDDTLGTIEMLRRMQLDDNERKFGSMLLMAGENSEWKRANVSVVNRSIGTDNPRPAMAEPLSPNHVFDFSADDPTLNEEDSDMEFEEDHEEKPKDDPEEVIPPVVGSPPGSPPISPPPTIGVLIGSDTAGPVTANGTLWVPPSGSTFEVGGPSSVSAPVGSKFNPIVSNNDECCKKLSQHEALETSKTN